MNKSSPQKTNITKTEEPKLKFTDSKAVFEHLEYLGYSLERSDDPINDVVIARALNRSTITVTISKDWVQFLSQYSGYDPAALNDIVFFQTLNQVNKSTVFTLWFAVDKDDKTDILINMYAIYRCYEKISFGNFVTSYEQEINTKLPGFAPWYKASD